MHTISKNQKFCLLLYFSFTVTLKKIVLNSAEKLSQDDCYSDSFHVNFDKKNFLFSHEEAVDL